MLIVTDYKYHKEKARDKLSDPSVTDLRCKPRRK